MSPAILLAFMREVGISAFLIFWGRPYPFVLFVFVVASMLLGQHFEKEIGSSFWVATALTGTGLLLGILYNPTFFLFHLF